MQIAGIVAEYNPFHNGHQYQIMRTRELGATHIVAVMSGNFVQRAEPAICPKHTRAAMALQSGADLILELPCPWAVAPAQHFARGAISLLHALGCVDILSFGSESGDLDTLLSAVRLLQNEAVQAQIPQLLASGITFAAAREQAVRHCNPAAADRLRQPNDTLAIEYIHALQQLQCGITPLAIPRVGAMHDAREAVSCYLSASQIRTRYVQGTLSDDYLPQSSLNLLQEAERQGNAPVTRSDMDIAMLSYLRRLTPQEIAQAPDVSEGMEHRIFQAIQKATSVEDMYAQAKTKRYTHARIRRIALSSFLNIRRSDAEGGVPYLRVLGMNAQGHEILKRAKQTATLPRILRAADVQALSDTRATHIWELECHASDQYHLATKSKKPAGQDAVTPAVQIF